MKIAIYFFLSLSLCWACTSNTSTEVQEETGEKENECGPAFEDTDIVLETILRNDSLNIILLSNLEESIEGDLSTEVYDFTGQELGSNKGSLNLDAGEMEVNMQVPISEINLENVKRNYLVVRFESKDGSQRKEGIVYFSEQLDLDPMPEIDVDVQPIISGYKVRLFSKSLVKDVRLAFPVEGTWSDNCFDLLPNKLGEYYFSIPEYTPDLEAKLELSYSN